MYWVSKQTLEIALDNAGKDSKGAEILVYHYVIRNVCKVVTL